MRSFKDHLKENIPPEVVGAAIAAPAIAHGAKMAVKGAYKAARGLYKAKKAANKTGEKVAKKLVK